MGQQNGEPRIENLLRVITFRERLQTIKRSFRQVRQERKFTMQLFPLVFESHQTQIWSPLQRATALRGKEPSASWMYHGDKTVSVILPSANFSTKMPEGSCCLLRPFGRNDRMNDNMIRLTSQDNLPSIGNRRLQGLRSPIAKQNRRTGSTARMASTRCEPCEVW